MGANPIFRIVLIFLVAATAIGGYGCDSESIRELEAADTLQVEFITGEASYSTFHVRLKTTASYGCNARLAYRFTNNKSQQTVFDIIGVEPGDGQCDQGARTNMESIDYTTQREFTLEIRNQKNVTRYLIQRSGTQWRDSLIQSEIPSNIHFIESN